MKKIEKQTIANYLHNLRVAYSGGKTLREFCKEHNFDASLWSMLENGLWHEFTAEEILEKYPPLFPRQEVSQPEENLGWGDTKLKFEKCDKNLLESIFGEDKRDEEDKKLDQRIIESHEDNIEEWEKKFSNLLLHYLDYDLEEKDLIEFIEQLLSERSFSKEELETLKQIIETHDGHGVGYEALSDMEEKIDRLLSLSK